MPTDEFRTKELLEHIVKVVSTLRKKGYTNVRLTFATKNILQFKPLAVVGYYSSKGAKYVIFTSKYFTSSEGHNTARYSSIRKVSFNFKGEAVPSEPLNPNKLEEEL